LIECPLRARTQAESETSPQARWLGLTGHRDQSIGGSMPSQHRTSRPRQNTNSPKPGCFCPGELATLMPWIRTFLPKCVVFLLHLVGLRGGGSDHTLPSRSNPPDASITFHVRFPSPGWARDSPSCRSERCESPWIPPPRETRRPGWKVDHHAISGSGSPPAHSPIPTSSLFLFWVLLVKVVTSWVK